MLKRSQSLAYWEEEESCEPRLGEVHKGNKRGAMGSGSIGREVLSWERAQMQRWFDHSSLFEASAFQMEWRGFVVELNMECGV